MNKNIRKSKLILSVIQLFVLLLVFTSLFQYINIQRVDAVAPGCYELIVPAGAPEAAGSYTEVDCPTEGAARAVSQFGACFVVVSRTSGSATVEERDCGNLSVSTGTVIDPLKNEEELCNESGGSWMFNGSPDQSFCDCPDSYIFNTSNGCLSLQELCEESGGSWQYDINVRQPRCVCDSDERLVSNRCIPPETISGTPGLGEVEINIPQGKYQCGNGNTVIYTSFNFGCKGAELQAQGVEINSIVDLAFAIFRVATAGVGLILILSVIIAGIQYSSSRGNPQAIESAQKRVINTVIALIFYVFIFSIANFLVPGGLLF